MFKYKEYKVAMSETIITLIHDDIDDATYDFMTGLEECNLTDIVEELSKLECTHVPNRIYTWANKVDTTVPIDFEVAFDVSLFFPEIKDLPDIETMTGKDQVIQDSIMRHPRFLSLAASIVTTVNEMKPREIGFICSYGKHLSVGWAYIMRKYIFKKSVIHNYTLRC